MDRTREALNYIQKAVEINPEHADYWYVYAEALEKDKQLDETREAYQKVIELEPENIEAWLDFSNFLHEQDSIISAIELMEEAIKEHPKAALLHYRFVAYLLKDCRTSEALIELESALQMEYKLHNELLKYYPEAQLISAVADLLELYKS